jgi:hypothetical protein
MTTEAPPMATLGEMIVEKVKGSPHPLKLAEVVKALPKPPKGVKPAAYKEQVNAALADEVRSGRLFAAPSGKGAEMRFWGRDERYLLRERGLQLADKPLELAKLRGKLSKEIKGVDAAYVEGQLRDLIGDGHLHEHQGKKGPLFASSPPTPLLERPANAKEVAKLAVSVEKLVKKTGVDVEAVLLALRKQMATATKPAAAAPEPVTSPPTLPVSRPVEANELTTRILAALERQGVMSIAELRREMPEGMRGGAFDEAVLQLDDEQRVTLSREADPSRYTEAEQAEFLRDGAALFTTIAKRG